MTPPPEAQEPVLSTLNEDGSRRKIRPRLAVGRFLLWRRIVGYTLVVLFAALPFIEVGGRPFFLLDIPGRKFIIFSSVFLATDTVVLMLFLVAVVIALFLLTALFGRVWCGWACPQTVYLELIFRPLERLFEGGAARQKRFDRDGGGSRRFAKNVVFFLVSFLFANVFVAYFVGGRVLLGWVVGAPTAHPAAFVTVGLTTLFMFLDFAWYREQTCIVACPYGRLQAVLLDRQSVIVGYDAGRGEPRTKWGQRRKSETVAAAAGDCIDCRSCVNCCPTGIDIRDGLQMECIGCTQCVDACDSIMDSLKKPRGLIRYTSAGELAGEKRAILRGRTVLYPLILVGLVGLLIAAISHKAVAEITLLRSKGRPFTLIKSDVSNHLKLKIVNRGQSDEIYRISLVQPKGLELIIPLNPLTVPEGRARTATAFVLAPATAFKRGELMMKLRVEAQGGGFSKVVSYRLLGPRGAQP